MKNYKSSRFVFLLIILAVVSINFGFYSHAFAFAMPCLTLIPQGYFCYSNNPSTGTINCACASGLSCPLYASGGYIYGQCVPTPSPTTPPATPAAPPTPATPAIPTTPATPACNCSGWAPVCPNNLNVLGGATLHGAPGTNGTGVQTRTCVTAFCPVATYPIVQACPPSAPTPVTPTPAPVTPTPATPTPALIPPYITGLKVSGVYSTNPALNYWLAGDQETISWDYAYFGTAKTNPTVGETLLGQTPIDVTVNTVSISLCNPTDLSKCSLFGSQAAGFDQTVPASLNNGGSGFWIDSHLYLNGSGNKTEKVGPNILQTIQNNPTGPLAAAFNKSTTMVKVCPSITTAPPGYSYLIGTLPTGGICFYSPVFSIRNLNISNSATYGLPSGRECIAGDCVCDNGQVKHCGNPMQSGAGCPAIGSCPAGPSASLGSRMMAALSALFNRFINLFNW